MHVFVHQIVPVAGLEHFQTRLQRRVHIQIGAIHTGQFFDELRPLCHLLIAASRVQVCMFHQQTLQRQRGGPARHCVIAQVGNPARLQVTADEGRDMGAVFCRHPGINAVQCDEIELRQIDIATRQFFEAVLQQRQVAQLRAVGQLKRRRHQQELPRLLQHGVAGRGQVQLRHRNAK